MTAALQLFRNRLASFSHDRRGAVMMIFAIAIIPVLIVSGVALDYTRAAMVRGKYESIADASVLVATTPSMMLQSASTAKTAVQNMFAAQAGLIAEPAYSASNLTVTVTDTTTTNGTQRAVSLKYNVSVTNSFGAFQGLPNTAFTVAADSTMTTAPNINFYLMLDNSGSMQVPSTQAGIDAMNAGTGCAFACHAQDSDTFVYARNNNITLRLDNVMTAAKTLATTAQSIMSGNGATYQLAAYTFSDGVKRILSLTKTNASNSSSIQTALGSISPPLMATNGTLASGESYTYPTGASTYSTVTLSSPTSNSDTGTNFNYAMATMSSNIPNPGNGTKAGGDTPQAVLMIVTDGVDDAGLYNSSYCSTSYVWAASNSYANFYRCQQPMTSSYCASMKARGIRIAVLYTPYIPLPENWWYANTVAPFISQVPTNLKNCASASNLYFEVSTGGDINAAMQQLFLTAIATAPHLTK